jgi:hypothetical protein
MDVAGYIMAAGTVGRNQAEEGDDEASEEHYRLGR